jgi:uncharacterized membrane protein
MGVERTVIKVASERIRDGLTVRDSYDLLLLVGLVLLLPGLFLLPIPLLRVPLGLVAVLFAPGYALVAALFPRRDDLDGVARAALSFGLSVAVLPVIALVLNALTWGIRPWPIALSLSLWILLLCSTALWRRRALASSGPVYMPPAIDGLGWWRGLSSRVRAYYIIGGLALAAVLIAGTVALLLPDPTARTTEFYVLGPKGIAENYPREVAPGQEMQVQLGISNREGTRARYRVEVRAEGQLLAQLGPIALEDGATWEAALRYALARAGDDQRIDILLFYNDHPTPYRQLRLWVNVRSKP